MTDDIVSYLKVLLKLGSVTIKKKSRYESFREMHIVSMVQTSSPENSFSLLLSICSSLKDIFKTFFFFGVVLDY